MADLTLEIDGARTLVEGVMAAIRHRIAARTLTPGARLPSIRALAKSMRVSKSTVVEAYDRLAAEGTIRSRPGSGFYAAGQLAPLSLAEIGPRLDREVDPLWVSRQSLEAGDEMLKPGCGWLPASWMPQAALRRALRNAARADDAALADYGTPLGLPPLRQLLARRMADHGIEVSPDQIMLTDSGTQAIDLLCRFLLEPGDAVLVDDPCYFNFHALLRAHQAKVVGVPYMPSGPDIELFAQALAEHRPRLYITNSGIHNPTGAILSPVTAHRLLKLADQAELTIVEDDIFADFEHTPAPRLAAFDGLQRVVQIGSLSKTLSASVRCGYIAAPRDWIDGLADLKIATTFGGGRLSSELVLALLRDGSYRKHVEQLRARLSRAMAESAGRLKAMGIVPWIDQPAGMFLWCRLPDGIDAADVARHALADNVVLAPGNAFSLSHTAGRFMRFNVAQCGDERIYRVLERAIAASRRKLG
ncbi:PLP-dependent aminotransferase family protein [Mesorhizobium sp. M1C.F.Ca.ET.193.01.1.1]|uniref:aminotransferase-like domain-containing protein n=1 Tax=unclassified Mesorhizobium TaxID=325217 RepID=UPI000FD5652F|nr:MULTISPECIES: PLP-dependent aminotransferase family protein [unclassified Mesorhizobium]TGT01425.1 PLP-dependent aminotransferase family protein [bacterium M00.F.Ca.ET.177.01.1.1]TGQ54184.1 PLP-dependent aminotransferase family protein [Mesorhizobium sp. M1C.F.Ca.ET.210.01.1.1]TGQ72197.1 PLP-dependent aminotransferase family protein [Mesorhizobium sp. M1C.F.Ca.ET.212.01.1.1]TGR10013.1 PLP-dependent aminotransferase family protein [Mesorhizobium sp. M1C.F.Ca.ET.204.01.1.1]TGR30133.1 PLP-depe